MNVWNFTGNLGRDAEVKHLPSGDTVTEFSVAVKAGYGKNEKTAWAKCSHWGATRLYLGASRLSDGLGHGVTQGETQ